MDEAARSWFSQVVDALKARVDHLDQLPREAAIIYGFENPPELDEEARQALQSPEGSAVAREFARLVEEEGLLSLESYRAVLPRVKEATRQKRPSFYIILSVRF